MWPNLQETAKYIKVISKFVLYYFMNKLFVNRKKSSRPEVFFRKGVLGIFVKFTEKRLLPESPI